MNPLNIEISRRKALGLGVMGATALGLTSCAGGSSTSASGGGGQEGSGTLQFWSNHPASSKDLEQQMIDAFMQENPDIPVELVSAGANYEELAQKFNAALAGGDLPDVIVASDVTWFNFAFNEATTPLDDLWKEVGTDPDSYVDTLREDYSYDGKHFGVPYCRSTCLMYFNTDILEKAGLPTDRGPETWQEFAEWAPKLVEANGGKPALVVPDGSNYLDWYFQGMIWTFGGAYSKEWEPTFTDAKSIEAGEFLKEMVGNGYIDIQTDPTVQFGAGNAAGLLESTGSLQGLNKTASIPFITTYLPGPTPGCPTGGAGLAVANGISDERKRNAVKFIDFMTNVENTVKFSQATGYMPVRKEAIEHEDEKKYLEKNPNAQTAIKQLAENTAPQDYARVFVPGGGARIGGALDRITVGQEDVTAVFEDLQKETEKTIEQQIAPFL